MDLKQAIHEFATAKTMPVDAIDYCFTNKDAALPGLIACVRRVSSGFATEDDEKAVFVIVHILGEARETAAFQPLLDFVNKDPTKVDQLLGDAITEHLHRIMISTFDGDVKRLESTIRCEDTDEYVREAAFRAWTYFAAFDNWPRDSIEAFLRNCFERLEPKVDNAVWSGWIDAISILKLENMKDLAIQAIKEERMSYGWIDEEDLEHDFDQSINADDYENWLRVNKRLSPFENTVATLSRWSRFASERHDHDEDYDAISQDLESALETEEEYDNFLSVYSNEPAYNPLKKVGRNDPCPCGSGKKFKKCCLN